MLTGSEHSTAEWRQPRREGGNQESLVGDFSLDLLERVGVRPNDSEANIDSPVCGRSKVRRLVRIHRPCIAVSGNREQWLALRTLHRLELLVTRQFLLPEIGRASCRESVQDW